MDVSSIGFCFNFPNISQLESALSLTVFAQDIPWQIHLKKTTKGTKSSLSIHLHCPKKDSDRSCKFIGWSCVASASFKLLSSCHNVESVEYYLLPQVFDGFDMTFGTSSFIDWVDLFDVNKCYVNNDAIKLDIKINVTNQNYHFKSAMILTNSFKTDCCLKYDLTITQIEKLTAVKSPRFEIQNSPITVTVCKYQDHLAMTLNTKCEELPWPMLVKVLSTKGEEKSVLHFGKPRVEKIIKWDELLRPKNGFVKIELLFMEASSLEFARNYFQTIASNISLPRFTMKIPEISKLQEGGIDSPEVMIYGIPWSVRVCKSLTDEKQALFVFLHRRKQSAFLNWPNMASFSVRLASFAAFEPVELRYFPRVYDGKFGYGDPLIEWNDLFDASKCYVKNDSITLDVQIDVADPNDPNKRELTFKKYTNYQNINPHMYQLTIQNIQSLSAVESPQFIIDDLPWHLTIFKHENQLGVLLALVGNKPSVSTNQMLVRILSSKREHRVEQVKTKCFQPGDDLYTTNFLSWNDLLKPENEFINNNNSIALEVEITFVPGLEPEPSTLECSICSESMKDKSVSATACGHIFCSPCITQSLMIRPNCPLCRKQAKFEELHRIYL